MIQFDVLQLVIKDLLETVEDVLLEEFVGGAWKKKLIKTCLIGG